MSRARTAGQRRADALVGLLLGLDTATVQSRHGRRPTVQVSVALSTLLGVDDQPGELDGYGPIPAGVARRMAGDPSGVWRRLVTDPLGQLVDYGRSTYRPPQDLTDYVIARDRTCRFPGCGRQSRSCELDHLLDWDAGGRTEKHNLLAGCPRHHHLRHDAGWRVDGDPEGTLSWVTPTGHTYDASIGRHPIDTTNANARGDPEPLPDSAVDEARSRTQTGASEQTEHDQPGDLARVMTKTGDDRPPF